MFYTNNPKPNNFSTNLFFVFISPPNSTWPLPHLTFDQAVSDAKKGLIAFKDVEKEAKAKRDQAQKTQSHAQKDLEDLVVELGGQKELQKVYIEARKAFPEDDLTFLREKLLELQEEIEASVDNPEVLRRYEELKQEAEKAQTELSRVESKLENYQETYRQRIEEWKRNVQQIAEKLNISFKEFMEALQYRGEVNMIETDMIANYEMQLKVCFRAESNMVELSGQRHSGGERAVSTVMYLMALQEMTSAPFRVVDEINQGMDERNERLVFDRIVQRFPRPYPYPLSLISFDRSCSIYLIEHKHTPPRYLT